MRPESADWYLLAADALLALHVSFVAFVIFGLVLIVVGGLRGWGWVRNRWFRIAHLAAIGVEFQSLPASALISIPSCLCLNFYQFLSLCFPPVSHCSPVHLSLPAIPFLSPQKV